MAEPAIRSTMPKSKTLSKIELKRQYVREHRETPQLPLFTERAPAPTHRGQCDKMPRPCPYVACRHHLFLHEAFSGAIKMPFGEDVSALKTMAETCTLDVADSGPQSQYRVSKLLNLTPQAVLQLEQKAMAKVRRYLQDEDDDPHIEPTSSSSEL